MVSATVLTLLVVPALYAVWREWQLRREWARALEPEADLGEPILAPAGAGD
ncbi:MAG: hypothetical protein HY561_13075 [Gemmatimonadetes bacterium]|nr:hypothetical protein [Gemmatimonadota bacterium]